MYRPLTEYLSEDAANEFEGKTYVLIIKNDELDGYDLFGSLTYTDSLCMLGTLTKAILNKWVPAEGYSVKRDVRDVVNAMLKANDAKPNDETEATLKKLRETLKLKHKEYTGEDNG